MIRWMYLSLGPDVSDRLQEKELATKGHQEPFWCEIKKMSDSLRLDVNTLARYVIEDQRVSRYGFSPAGKGYGGSCLPKDMKQMIDVACDLGLPMSIYEAMEEENAGYLPGL